MTIYSECFRIVNPQVIDLYKLTPITKEFKKDDFFQEYSFQYYSGKYRAQIVEYPVGGGSVLNMEIISGKNFLFDRVVIGIKEGEDVATYYWMKKSSACRNVINTKFQDVTSIRAYLPEDLTPKNG